MSIAPLAKVTLYGPGGEKDAVLEALQRLGCVHLNDLRGGGESGASPAPPAGAHEALQYLQDAPARRRPLGRRAEVDLDGLVREVLEVRDRARALTEELAQLRVWIADLEPWGEFELPAWAREGARRFWFYAVPLYQLGRLEALDAAWTVAARDHRFAYVVVIAAEPPSGMPVAPSALEGRSLFALRARLEEVERELEELEYRRIGFTLYTGLLGKALAEADDRAARQRASRKALERDGLFALQGWAPETRAPALRAFADEHRLALTVEAPGPEDRPPTLLDNPAPLRGAESLITFYMTPGYRMWDPSALVLFGFAIFFAMIFCDAGYGVVLGGILLFLWKRMGATPNGRGLRNVVATLVVFSIVYGVLAGSYCGVAPPPDSWLASLQVVDASDQGVMMWLAISVGAAHLGLANVVTAWRRRRSPRALAALGWVAIILGGYGVALGKGPASNPPLAEAGFLCLELGGLLVLFFTSKRPITFNPRDLVGRFVDGLKGAVELSKAFGDVLSYLRLFALGLASVKLAEVFNHLAGQSFEAGGIGVLLGIVVLVVGHAINFVMGIMGGVVHSLRLNLIEFFSWSLPEEGERFEAFTKKAPV